MQVEEKKIIAKYVKHMTTLATGSLVLLVTFLEKLSQRPRWKIAVAIALIAFLVSIVGGVLVYTMTILTFKTYPGTGEEATSENMEKVPEVGQTINVIGVALLWIGFLIGVIALTIFAVRNLIF